EQWEREHAKPELTPEEQIARVRQIFGITDPGARQADHVAASRAPQAENPGSGATPPETAQPAPADGLEPETRPSSAVMSRYVPLCSDKNEGEGEPKARTK